MQDLYPTQKLMWYTMQMMWLPSGNTIYIDADHVICPARSMSSKGGYCLLDAWIFGSRYLSLARVRGAMSSKSAIEGARMRHGSGCFRPYGEREK